MKIMARCLALLLLAFVLQQCSYSQSKKQTTKMDNKQNTANPAYSRTDTGKVNMSEEEWKKVLPQEVYNIARLKGTERPWTSKYEDSKEIGTYYCAACGNAL